MSVCSKLIKDVADSSIRWKVYALPSLRSFTCATLTKPTSAA